jgi:P-type E1-E2 ATPase
MGGADNVCTDKTGTLTKNLMTVVKMFVQGQVRDVAGSIRASILKQ